MENDASFKKISENADNVFAIFTIIIGLFIVMCVCIECSSYINSMYWAIVVGTFSLLYGTILLLNKKLL